uniref:Uncharacterized protein n=1 Tax=Rhodococcus hoagii TaxID=43767 RepID=A0A1Z1V0D6_RHOHA|nr:hypothetical protein [Prescottella equi]ARX60580.1 hypothetical protein pVAPB1413_0799 [Prescottella equi]ARX60685.1 hypothetical protein pVAPB1533_0799 [Prescottella equi]
MQERITRVADEDNDTGIVDGEDLRLPSIDAAVVTVGAAAHGGRTRISPQVSPWTVMEQYADLICTRTPLRVLRLPMTTGDVQLVASRIVTTAPRVSLAFVTGVGAGESARVKSEVASQGGPLVLTELDVITAALAGTTISILRRSGAAPGFGRIVINGPERAPLLGPTLMKSGIAEITNWHSSDAHAFPLRRLMEHHDVLIDLAGTAADTDAPGRTVRYPAEPFRLGQLIVPGLIGALCGHEIGEVTAEILAAAARALALITPVGQALPDPGDSLVTPAIARQVGRVVIHLTDRGTH